jgi:hypothetical protein
VASERRALIALIRPHKILRDAEPLLKAVAQIEIGVREPFGSRLLVELYCLFRIGNERVATSFK